MNLYVSAENIPLCNSLSGYNPFPSGSSIDTSREDNDIALFKNILNDMYAKDLSRKVKVAKRQRAYKGLFISAQTPYGYNIDPKNKNHIVVDEEVSAIVKEIFRLALSGKSLVQISRILTENQILTPGSYKAMKGDARFERYLKEGKISFRWCYQTIRAILKGRVYVGDMVNHRYEISNYKTKRAYLHAGRKTHCCR